MFVLSYSRRRGGYSLVELIIVVGIIAVVAASAAPSLVRSMPERRMKRASWRIYMDLQEAKAKAVSENVEVSVTVRASDKEYTIWADENGNGLRDTGEEWVRSLGDLPGCTLFAYPSTAVFEPSGTCAPTLSSGSTFYFFRIQLTTAGLGTRRVYVFPNGHIDPHQIHEAL